MRRPRPPEDETDAAFAAAEGRAPWAMRGTRWARWGALAVLAAALVVAWPVGRAWVEARSDAPALAARADALIAEGRGADGLGGGRWARLLMVQDPGFEAHGGVDLSTPGAGITTVTQSLAKRTAFDEFRPGWAKLRQTGYALGLETRLSKAQIAALWLDTVEIGRTPDGWAVGLDAGARALFGRAPAALDEPQFRSLVARLIAPAALGDDPVARAKREARIARLWAGACAPLDHGDVWLEGCA